MAYSMPDSQFGQIGKPALVGTPEKIAELSLLYLNSYMDTDPMQVGAALFLTM